MPEVKKEEKEFTDKQVLAAQLIAATFPGYYASHGQLMRAQKDAVDIAHSIIEIIKKEF